jgi:transketolase
LPFWVANPRPQSGNAKNAKEASMGHGERSRIGFDVSAAVEEKARFIRLETVRLTRIAGAGHYGSTFSAAELFAALYYSALRINPAMPDWPDRDRFVLSKGHAAIGLYPVLADLGYFPAADLDGYTRLGSPFGDHPDMRKVPGADFSSGSLGHGLSVALGMALGGRLSGREFRTYCMVGDGELCEGQIWEAAMAASHFRAGHLVCIVDRNELSIDGKTEDILAVQPIAEKFRAFGWETREIDGHDIKAILAAFDSLPTGAVGPPQAIVAHTVKGRGVARMEGDADWHLGNLAGEDLDDVIEELQCLTR